jgi:hypothetical protein
VGRAVEPGGRLAADAPARQDATGEKNGVFEVSGIYVYTCAFGEVRLPEATTVRMNKNGWPDRRFAEGRRYTAYLRHIDKKAEREFLAGRYLESAPPYSTWKWSDAS